jgi:TIR domain
MAHDVFVSHSEKDKAVADAVVARLEAESVSCWVAPRDIVPGADWGESIINAIESSRIMILIFTQNANVSPQIKREVERAVNKGVYVIPFRVDDIPPARSLEYFISTSQWMDAFSPPLEPHLDNLAKTVKSVLKSPPLPSLNVPVRPEKPLIPRPSIPPPSWRKSIFIAVAISVLMIVGGAGWYLGRKREVPSGKLTVTPTEPSTPVAMQSAVVIPAPTPVPALTSPPSSPISNIIDDEEVRKFVTDHYNATERRNVEDILSQYDDLVDYLDYGRRDRAFIRNDIIAYFKRWPIVSFSFTPNEIGVARSVLPNRATAYFEIRFLVRDPASRRSNSGRAKEEWVISKKSGSLKLVSQKETVQSD